MAQPNSIPSDVLALLAAADKKNGFPAGTMASVLQQEVGGNAGKYLADPTAYHYGLNEEGKRIAPQSGKVSTAFGPFGILESTAANPGYGVAPLKDKSLAEQVRFASEYLAARSKNGGLEAGLAGYGEGPKYAQSVLARTGQAPVAQAAPVQVAQVEAQPLPEAPAQVAAISPDVIAPNPEAWKQLEAAIPEPVAANSLDFGSKSAPVINPLAYLSTPEINFKAFGRLRGRG